MSMAVILLLMSRVLGFGGGKIGLIFAVGGLGALLGSATAPRLARR